MAQFPKTEQGIVALAEAMISGFVAYSEDFPSGDPTGMQTILNRFRQYDDEQLAAELGAKTATVSKDEQLNTLVETIKTALKRAEADVAATPEKLAEIGWSARQQPQPVALPGAPTVLHSVAEGQGRISMAWERPANSSGGQVRNYVIERRQQPQGQPFSDWTFAGTCYNCDVTLTDQPMDATLEYRVRASNIAGEGAPSNSISVTLP